MNDKMKKEQIGSQSASPQRPTNTTVGYRTGTYCSFWSPIGPGRNETTADAPFPTLHSTAPHSRCHGDPVTSFAVVTSTRVQVYQIPTWFVVPDVWGLHWRQNLMVGTNPLLSVSKVINCGLQSEQNGNQSVRFFNLIKHQKQMLTQTTHCAACFFCFFVCFFPHWFCFRGL